MNPLKLTGRRPRTGAALLLLWLGLLSATGLRADVPPEAVEQGLQAAGANRASLERVLEDYRRGPSREKYDAACYLVAHMRWHKRAGYVERYDPRLDSLWTVATTAYLKLTTGHSAADQRRQPLRKALNDTAAALRKRTQALRLTPPAMHIEELPDAASLTGDYVRRQVEHALRGSRLRRHRRETRGESLRDDPPGTHPHRHGVGNEHDSGRAHGPEFHRREL